MQTIVLSHASPYFAGSLKPLMLAALATGAGVAAFVSPASRGPGGDIAAQRAAVTPLTEMALAAEPGAPAVKALLRPAPARASAAAVAAAASVPRGPVASAPPARSPAAAPGFAPTELISPTKLLAVEFSLSGPPLPQVPQPHSQAPQPQAPQPQGAQSQAMMPAAELKAMMAHAAATRGDGDGDHTAPDARQALASAGNIAGQDEAPSSIRNPGQTAQGVEFEVAALVNGEPAGRVPLRIADGENISVRLRDILTALRPMIGQSAYDALSASSQADAFVTLGTLRENGVPVRFDGRDRLILGRT